MEWSMEAFANNAGGARNNRGWAEYFPGEPYSNSDGRVILLEEIAAYLRRPEGQGLLSQVTPNGSTYALPINVDFLRHSLLLPRGFFATLDEKSHEAISCLGTAVYDALFCTDGDSMRPGRIHIKIFNFAGSVLALKRLKAVTINTLISIRGTVIRTAVAKPMVLSMSFTCKKCGDMRDHVLEDGIYCTPAKCLCADCGSRAFERNLKSSKLIDFHKIRIQEILRPNEHEEGRMPRIVDCELREDLVDAYGTGDVVTICGFFKRINIENAGGKSTSKNDGLYHLCVEVLSVIHSKDHNREGRAEAMGPITAGFTPLDLEFVVKFAEESGSNMFRNIVHSICPSIYGHELVKAGISLALLGGVCQNPGRLTSPSVISGCYQSLITDN